jgi:hypothetical protein
MTAAASAMDQSTSIKDENSSTIIKFNPTTDEILMREAFDILNEKANNLEKKITEIIQEHSNTEAEFVITRNNLAPYVDDNLNIITKPDDLIFSIKLFY